MLAEALISSLPLLGAILRQVWTQYLWKTSPASHMASLMALSVSWRIMIIKCSRSMETGLCLWNWPGWTQKTATAENIGLQAEQVEAILVFLCGHSNEVRIITIQPISNWSKRICRSDFTVLWDFRFCEFHGFQAKFVRWFLIFTWWRKRSSDRDFKFDPAAKEEPLDSEDSTEVHVALNCPTSTKS